MNHLTHIQTNKELLETRFFILRLVREFFWKENFTEVETPLIVNVPGQEPNIVPMKINIHNEKIVEFSGFLHTSPEYAMKKMLAAGFENIFYLGKCFRDRESFGGSHNPEFTMMEWYRVGKNYVDIMNDAENLFHFIAEKTEGHNGIDKINLAKIKKQWQRKTMKSLWHEFLQINLDDFLTQEKMFELCVGKKYNVSKEESYEELFYRIFLNEIESKLGIDVPLIVHEYPAQMASLAKLLEKDSRYAERFEVYFNGLELANAFSELTDADEQESRLREERNFREKTGKDVYDIDQEFIGALRAGMPESAGIALGIDRMAMLFTGCQEIDNVITLPMSKLF
ncbi:EF-P lysine aminoacylase GenX [Patescibacteria group bacterium]|nr:EF-P lysine aminoacylase GenX [Patescibacteria group bacterium]